MPCKTSKQTRLTGALYATYVFMKFILLIAAILFLIMSSCSSEYPEHPNFTLSAKQTGYKVVTLGGDSISIYHLTLDLKPKYDTLAPIYLMTCSWGYDNAITNDSLWFLGYPGCDANFMSIHRVDSGRYIELKISATNEKLFKNTSNKNFRIGIAIADTLDYSFRKQFWDSYEAKNEKFDQFKLDPKRIVWSNKITVQEQDTVPFYIGGFVQVVNGGI